MNPTKINDPKSTKPAARHTQTAIDESSTAKRWRFRMAVTVFVLWLLYLAWVAMKVITQ